MLQVVDHHQVDIYGLLSSKAALLENLSYKKYELKKYELDELHRKTCNK